MKDIRLLGDVVRVKLKESGIPAGPYILAENLFLLFLAANFTFYLPFSEVTHTFLPLAVIIIGTIYGIKSGMAGIALFIIMVHLGLPGFAIESIPFFPVEGYLLALLPAVLISGLSANFEWDRDLRRSLYYITFCQLLVIGCSALWLRYFGAAEVLNLKGMLVQLVPAIACSTILGALVLKITWSAVLHMDADGESASN